MQKFTLLGITLYDYGVREALRNTDRFLATGGLNTVAYISSAQIAQASRDEGLKDCVEQLDMTVCTEPDLLEAAGIAGRSRIHEIDEKHDIPSVGFGMGIERILYFLEKEGVELPPMETPDLYVGILGADARAKAYKLVNEIRSHGLIVETDYMDRSVKAQMKYANKIGAKKVVIIGADELLKGTANVKDMATGEQTEAALNELPALFS